MSKPIELSLDQHRRLTALAEHTNVPLEVLLRDAVNALLRENGAILDEELLPLGNRDGK